MVDTGGGGSSNLDATEVSVGVERPGDVDQGYVSSNMAILYS
jgi:hypothetical protein